MNLEERFAQLLENLKKLAKHFGLQMNYYTYMDNDGELVVRFQSQKREQQNERDET